MAMLDGMVGLVQLLICESLSPSPSPPPSLPRSLAPIAPRSRSLPSCDPRAGARLTDLSSPLIVELPSLSTDEEVLPRQSRFFSRNAIGCYFDIRQDALERGERTSKDPRIGPGCALFVRRALPSLLPAPCAHASTSLPPAAPHSSPTPSSRPRRRALPTSRPASSTSTS